MSETLKLKLESRKPQTGKSIKHSILKTTSSSYNPYSRRKPSQSINSFNQSNQDLNQVEHGIVAGSSLFQSTHLQNQPPNQPTQKSSLLGKCVGWLFGAHSKPPSTTNHQIDSSIPSNQLTINQSPSSLPKLSNLSSSNLNHPPLSSSSSSSSFLQPPPSRLTPSITLPQLSAPQQPWYRSQSPFIPFPSQPNGIPTSTSTSSLSFATRRPRVTPHAQLQIFPTDTSSSNHHQNQSNDLNPSSELRMRSVSPYRKSVIRSSALSPVHQRSTSPFRQQTNLFNRPPPRSSNLNDTNRRGTSVFSYRQGSVAKDVDFTNRKRFADEMSISPVRNPNPESGGDQTSFVGSDPNGSISKKQMCWDPELGFMTQEQMNNLKAERERQKRELEGRPFPKNEAERILEALESRRGATSALSEAMRTPNLPQIPVPTPASIATQRSSSIQLLARSKTKNSLAALYEEEELEMLNMSNKKLIAPFNKRIEKDRIKRLEERKGKLREELKKLQRYEEKLNRENINKEVEDQDMQEDRPRRHRSKSTDIANGDNSQLRRSSRKIGKLTSSSTKAKVNSGRRSRDPSVADEENLEPIATPSTRITRSALRSSAEKNSVVGNVDPSPKNKKTTKTGLNAIKSPSPIPEAEEDQNADSVMATKLLSPEVEESNGPTALRSLIRSSSAALQPATNQRQQRASSSLRPGRTFSSRQSAHKPKVFSAREEDLPSLGDDDDEDDSSASKQEIASLKKIKLPTTFPSSFKLEKFASFKPTPTSAQPDQTQDQTQTQTNSQSIFQRIAAPASEKTEPAPTFSFNKPASTANPSPFFSKPVDPTPSAATPSAPSNEQVGSTSTTNFSRIPSGQAPPNFFSNITSSATEKPTPKTNLFGNPEPTSTTSSAAAADKNETGNTSMGVDKEATAAPVAPTSIFGTNTGSLGFNSSNPKSLFGATPAPTTTTETQSLFGTTPTSSTAEPKSLFGSAITAAQPETKSLFGGFATSNATTEPKSMFGSAATPSTTTEPKLTFDSSTTVTEAGKEPKSLFGTAVTAPSTTTATNQNNSSSSIFGSSNPTPSFAFGAATPAATTTSSTSLFGNPVSSNPIGSGGTSGVSTGFSFGGGITPSVSSQPTNLFGSNNVESTKTNPTSPSLFGSNVQSTNPAGSGFSFNSTNTPVSNASTSLFGNPSAPVTSSAPTPSFSFGASTNTTLTAAQPPPVSSSPFSFNTPAPVTTPAATTSTPFTFGGTPSVTTNGNTSSMFGSTGVTATPPIQANGTSNGFSFGAASATPIVPPSATPSSSTFTFGASTTTAAPDSIFGKPGSTSSNGFTFGSGSVAGGSSSGSLFGNGTKENGTGVMNTFGTGSSTMSSFGNGNGFGTGTGTGTPGVGTASTGGFTFGASNNPPVTPGTPAGGNVLFSMGVSGGGSNESVGGVGGSGRQVKKLPGGRNKKR